MKPLKVETQEPYEVCAVAEKQSRQYLLTAVLIVGSYLTLEVFDSIGFSMIS